MISLFVFLFSSSFCPLVDLSICLFPITLIICQWISFNSLPPSLVISLLCLVVSQQQPSYHIIFISIIRFNSSTSSVKRLINSWFHYSLPCVNLHCFSIFSFSSPISVSQFETSFCTVVISSAVSLRTHFARELSYSSLRFHPSHFSIPSILPLFPILFCISFKYQSSFSRIDEWGLIGYHKQCQALGHCVKMDYLLALGRHLLLLLFLPVRSLCSYVLFLPNRIQSILWSSDLVLSDMTGNQVYRSRVIPILSWSVCLLLCLSFLATPSSVLLLFICNWHGSSCTRIFSAFFHFSIFYVTFPIRHCFSSY